MGRVRYTSVLVILALALAVGVGLWRWWQGPQVQGYVLERQPLVQTVVATGRVVTTSRAQVGSEITGVVLERHVEEGDSVMPGDTLLVLRSDELAAQVREAEAALTELATSRRPQARVALERAESELAQARRETARRRTLAERALLSTEALEQAEQAQTLARNALDAARLTATALAPGNVEETLLRERLAALQARLAKTVVRSEVAGTVLTRDAEPGDLVQPGQVLFTIALSGATEIRVPLDERNLALLALQQDAMAVADAYPQRPFPARVGFIAPSIDPQRGTVEVRLAVDPVPDFLRQDMTVSVNIETGRREQSLAIPNDALADVQGDQARVWVVREGRVQRQEVTLGLRGLAMTEVLDGLRAGDRVLADPTTALEEGARVRFAPRAAPVSGSGEDAATRNELPVNFN
ncbi:efflux RND transporter periplasmic adaptor subunit [Halomonas sp. SSL-5]|uniref:efflux RND transporter periplasmic adaptor subunit n=1 Tax=Halomonas sp. SSL-5 TaxID=3065855 RepID=UPI002739595A|nr:efflux RND transporter periplasmic adaptor subunit [Halomonas sp. SSL-5]MDY7115180.1 efflux RND transporter periplasmic adaptor subunit [Halomonas sp. SSL-5]